MLDMAVLLSIDVALTMQFFLCAPRKHPDDFGTCESPQNGCSSSSWSTSWFAGFPSAFQCSGGDDHLPALRIRSQVVAWVLAVVLLVLNAGYSPMRLRWLCPATRPIRLELASSGRGAARIDGHHRYGVWQKLLLVAGLHSFDALSLLGATAIVIVGIGDRIGNLQLSN